MPKLRVHCFGISLDGFGAGLEQSTDNPLGIGGTELLSWMFGTRTFQQMHGREGGSTGIDDDFTARGITNIGAWIIGRNMFGPVRGTWPDEGWKGWWGNNPPFHTDVFVLTHYPRESCPMEGETSFHFVTGGIRVALQRAYEASKGKDVRLGGGVATIRQYLRAGLIDEMHLAISPVLLGSGENLLGDVDARKRGYCCTQHVASPNATHVVLAKGS
jgi:dihydrofolate reductase